MRFTISATAILAMAMSAFAQTADFNPVYTPAKDAVVEAGSTFQITWEAPAKYAEGTISISLIGGATQGTQVPLQQIAAGVPNSAETYAWTVDATLGKDAVYGLVVRYESNPEVFQYSNPFSIKPAAEVPAESSTTSAAEVPATTVTTQHGAVTVTLSSCTTSTTPIVTPSSTPVFSSTPVHTFTSAPAHNTTFSTVKPVVPSTSATFVVPPVPSQSPPPAPPAETPISGAGRVVSGGLVIVGGVMAMLAL